MTDGAPQGNQADLLDELRELVGQDLDAAAAVEDPADIEFLALSLAEPFVEPELPDEVIAPLPAVISERGDELAAGVLCAMARLAPAPLGRLAAAECDGLAARGVRSPV